MDQETEEPGIGLEDFERAVASMNNASRLLKEMAENVGKLAETCEGFRRTLGEHSAVVQLGADAMHWKPLPVHWCGDVHAGRDHPGHGWDWLPPEGYVRSGEAVRSSCPGYPLPSTSGRRLDV